MVLLGSANRDESKSRKRIASTRIGPVRRTCPSGTASHFCLGAQLGRMEGRLGLEVLLRASPDWSAGPNR